MSRGKFVVLLVSLGLVLAGCQASKPTSSAPAPSTTAAPPAPKVTPPKPAETTSREIAIPAPAKTSKGLVAELAPTKTSSFSLLGVTWDKTANDENVTVAVRVRKADGWTDWEPLGVSDEGEESDRGGTDPWWIEDADEVSARVTTASGASPTGIKVITVDPDKTPTPEPTVVTNQAFYSTKSTSKVVSAADGKPLFTPQPPIIMRSSWGAKAANNCDSPIYGETTKGVNIHHTAGTNSYSKSQSASIIRGIQQYHQNGQHWCDIGYSFIVDKYGQIFEGRAGGINRPVRGAFSGHAGVNQLTMGVALMGNLDKVKPSTAMKDATVKLVGWRIGTFYLWPVLGGLNIGGKWLQRVSGHRNVISTACPGKYGYAWLEAKDGLRVRVSNYVSQYRSAIKSAAWRLDGLNFSVTGPVEAGEMGSATWRQAAFTKYDFFWRSSSTVAFYVTGGARTKHRELGGQGAFAGKLGFPTQNMTATASPTLSVQKFDRGAIYQVGSGSLAWYALWDDIYKTYVADSNATKLGRPTSSITQSGDIKTATFEHGTITQKGTSTPVVVITGAPAEKTPPAAPGEPTEPTEPTEPVEPTEPTTPPSEDGVAPISLNGSERAFPVLWLRRSGMISA